MRILHYYWTQYDDMEKPGGGVRVYLDNIVNIQKDDNETMVLNSGVDYDLSNKCYIKFLRNNNGVKQFSVFNSPMIAPSKCSFNNQSTYLNNKELTGVIKKFLEKNGPFDIIHFHSLEGLTLDVLKLKDYFPNTKFILSLHNYYPFCPQVNLYVPFVELLYTTSILAVSLSMNSELATPVALVMITCGCSSPSCLTQPVTLYFSPTISASLSS